jgi:hypothetical protein
MKISLTVLFLLLAFCATFLISYRSRFQVNPQKTSIFALGVASLVTVFILVLIIPLLSIIVMIFPLGLLYGVGFVILFLSPVAVMGTDFPMKKVIASITGLAFLTALGFSIPYAVVPFYLSEE